MPYRNLTKFNDKWFSKWKSIKSIEPHFIKLVDEEGEDRETVMDFIDIVFADGDRIRIEADSQAWAEEEGNCPNSIGFIRVKTAEMKQVDFPKEVIEDKKETG